MRDVKYALVFEKITHLTEVLISVFFSSEDNHFVTTVTVCKCYERHLFYFYFFTFQCSDICTILHDNKCILFLLTKFLFFNQCLSLVNTKNVTDF